MNELLIFDLDDTIFETRSIEGKSIKSILDKFEILLITKYGKKTTKRIVSELWKYPFDFVADKYKFDKYQNIEFARLVNEQEYKLNIKVFEDFKVVQNLKQEKILVTTGFLKLQKAKIHHLRIGNMFSQIYIDNILDTKRNFKKGIFKTIILEKDIEPKLVYVIGDNPNSELKAGFELGINIVQMAKFGQEKSEYTDYFISDFNELITILE